MTRNTEQQEVVGHLPEIGECSSHWAKLRYNKGNSIINNQGLERLI